MDYGRSELADRLAAEYAVGSLRGPARRRFETLLPAHPGLRAALSDWEQRLMPLTAGVAPQVPSPTVWKRIEARLGGSVVNSSVGTATVPWWRQLGVWRAASALAGGAALGLALLLGSPGPVQPPLVVVLSSTERAGGGVAPASFVAGISADGRSMVTRPIQNVSLQADKAFELWSVPASGNPRSLGLISASGATVVERRKLLDGTAALAVSLEPVGGSPTGLPTGPVVFVGKLTL